MPENIADPYEATSPLTQTSNPLSAEDPFYISAKEEKSEVAIKPTIVLLVYVHPDGTGDFSHARDCYLELKLLFPGYEFILVVSCADNRLEEIETRIKEMNLPHFFFDEDAEFYRNSELQKILQRAEQLFLISNPDFPSLREYEYLLNPNAICNFIGEHEADPIWDEDTTRVWHQYSMGLSPNCHGIKLRPKNELSPQEAFSIIKTEERSFFETLLQNTKVSTAEEFLENYTVVPAYFRNLLPLVKFIAILGFLTSDQIIKNPLIYASGSALRSCDDYNHLLSSLLAKSHVKQIVIISPEIKVEIVDCNPEGTQTFHILSGFNVNSLTYNKLFTLAKVAGISGDNTLEKIFSEEIFPFYCSTNAEMKMPLIEGLCDIINEIAEIPNKIKGNYTTYFLLANQDTSEQDIANVSHELELFKSLDFKEMMAHWPRVVAHLREKYNFYDKLPVIFLKQIPKPNKHKDLLNLLYFAAHGDITQLCDLLIKKPDLINETINGSSNALVLAAQYGHINMVDWLLQQPNIDPNKGTNEKFTALDAASEGGHVNVVTALINHPRTQEANKETHKCSSPLIRAIREKKTEVVRALLRSTQVNLNKKIGFHTPLSAAVETGQVLIFQMLLAKGAVINHTILTDLLQVAKVNKQKHMFDLLVALSKQLATGKPPIVSNTSVGNSSFSLYYSHPKLSSKKPIETALLPAVKKRCVRSADV